MQSGNLAIHREASSMTNMVCLYDRIAVSIVAGPIQRVGRVGKCIQHGSMRFC